MVESKLATHHVSRRPRRPIIAQVGDDVVCVYAQGGHLNARHIHNLYVERQIAVRIQNSAVKWKPYVGFSIRDLERNRLIRPKGCTVVRKQIRAHRRRVPLSVLEETVEFQVPAADLDPQVLNLGFEPNLRRCLVPRKLPAETKRRVGFREDVVAIHGSACAPARWIPDETTSCAAFPERSPRCES